MEEGKARSVTADEVITKLKDDGDFDTLRLRIIRKLKENEDLRNSIIAAVKQSAALNSPGAENLKPRQLSDTIHQEIGGKVMGQISDALWAVIRSDDGMKKEITETVQSVYNTLANPRGKEVQDGLSPAHQVTSKDMNGPSDNNPPTAVTASEQNSPSKSGVTELPNQNQAGDSQEARHKELIPEHGPSEGATNESHDAPDASQSQVSKGAGSPIRHGKRGDVVEEDPDVPPGFG